MSMRLFKLPPWLRVKLKPLLATRAVLRIMNRGHGYMRSLRTGYPVDSQGRALPWFTYPAIEFLVQFDFSKLDIFEFGAGQSTLFWETRARRVVSVESDAQWHMRLKALVGPKVSLILAQNADAYVAALTAQKDTFDVIVIDGIFRDECCRAAVPMLKAGGMIILDNAERYPGYAEGLRAAGLLQVDMSGFGPFNDYTWTTSFFFHRAFDFPHRGSGRPERGIGSIPFNPPAPAA